jgi:L-amino acid N-acyltransferase YncA
VGIGQCYEAQMNPDSNADLEIRAAVRGDAEAIAAIFNQGVEDRIATFETRPATVEEAVGWVESDVVVVGGSRSSATTNTAAGSILGWAKAGLYSDQHDYYAGIREATLYVARDARRRGLGRALLDALATSAGEAGAHKLVGKIFTSNEPSIALVKRLGWREVGVHRRHGTLDGEWKDVLVVEKLLGGDA